MAKKATYALQYGVFMLASRAGDRKNGCITNTCMQVANSPVRVAISVLNTNYTCDLIKESGVFTVSILDETVTFETIQHFGLQSGHNVDKMKNLTLPEDTNGVPYLNQACCGVLSCRVVQSTDLGSHTLFVAEVLDQQVLSDNTPLTYAKYMSDIKPKPEKKEESRKIIGWRCKICQYVYEGEKLPEDFTCPLCGHGPEDFEPIYE